ncbi:MAG: DUF1828 domain-containing protein [Selenomonadaceae bacterium]|nr:DUF1828 domain-containing protein [Selenomonadaceae bacterium]
MNFNDIKSLLQNSFGNHFNIEQKRNHLYQIFVPIFYDDGDMMDIFIQDTGNELRVCDCGMTLMRLSYTFGISTEHRKKLLADILNADGAIMDNGNICIPSSPELLFENVMQISQTITKILALRYTSQRHVASLFYEDLDEYILSALKDFSPQKGYAPLKGREEYGVDYVFSIKNKPPVFLFGIRGNEKALSSALSVLAFQKENIAFTSVAVHDNLGDLSIVNQKKVTNAMDKQFYDYSSFEETSSEFLLRLAA